MYEYILCENYGKETSNRSSFIIFVIQSYYHFMDNSTWSDKLRKLRTIIRKDDYLEEAKDSIIELHAMVYSAEMSGTAGITFEDPLWEMTEQVLRTAVNKKGRTILYGMWHSSRIEDITMNLLVAGTDQIFGKDNWQLKINSPIQHTGNSLSKEEILEMSSILNIEELKRYRIAVGRNSENIIRRLKSGEMRRKVYKENLRRIFDEAAVDRADSAEWLVDFWSKKDVAGIILMPCLRHQLTHIHESMAVKI